LTCSEVKYNRLASSISFNKAFLLVKRRRTQSKELASRAQTKGHAAEAAVEEHVIQDAAKDLYSPVYFQYHLGCSARSNFHKKKPTLIRAASVSAQVVTELLY